MPVLADSYITLSQASHQLGCSPQTVRKLADSGQIGCVRTGLGRLVDASDIERLAAVRAARVLGQDDAGDAA